MGGGGVGLDSGGGSRGASFGGLGMRAMFRLSLATIGRLRGEVGGFSLRACAHLGQPSFALRASEGTLLRATHHAGQALRSA